MGTGEEGVPSELDLAAGQLFMEWLDAEKAAADAAEKLRREQAEAEVQSFSRLSAWPYCWIAQKGLPQGKHPRLLS